MAWRETTRLQGGPLCREDLGWVGLSFIDLDVSCTANSAQLPNARAEQGEIEASPTQYHDHRVNPVLLRDHRENFLLSPNIVMLSTVAFHARGTGDLAIF